MEQPSILVRILHSIPHVNYTFQRVNDTFNPDSDVYLESLGILASVPAGLLILSLFGLLLYLLSRCCDRKPRKPSAQRCQSCTLVIITLMTCGAIGLGFYGNDDFHNGLLKAFNSGKEVEGLVLSLKRQTEAIKYDLETKMAQHKIESQIEKVQYNQTAVMMLIETCGLVRENTSRAVTSLDNMVLYFMKTKGSENDTSLMGLLHLGELYESIRWPITLGFLGLLVLLCAILIIGVARRSRCTLIFFSVAGLFCIIFCWLLAGIYLASSVAAGDFCMRPHEHMCRQVGMRSPYVYFLNCGTLRNRFILRLNESRDLVERARESVYLVQRMSQETYPRIDVHKTLEAMDNDLEETKRNLTVLSATLDRRAIDKYYADGLRSLCTGGLLGLSLMMVAGVLTSFLLTILVYADSHAWIYLTKRPRTLDADKSETAPLFPSNAPSANISPTAPISTGTINRTLLHHHQQTHGIGVGSSGTLMSHRNGSAGMRTGLASYNNKHHLHKTNHASSGGIGGVGDANGGRSSPSPPPGYDVVVHGTRSGHHTLGRLPSHHQQSSSGYLAGPNNGNSNANSLKNIFASATLPRSAGSSIRSVLSSQTAHTICKSTGMGLDRDDGKDPRDVTSTAFNRFDPKYISIGPKAVRGNNNLNIVAAATANKCATLRHVGRYGGSLKGASPAPNLRSAKTPSIATVSKDYCQQPDCIPQTYTTEMVMPTQHQPAPPAAPLPPPKTKIVNNTFTEIPGTTGVGSSYAKEQQLLIQQQQLLQQHQQQHQQLQQLQQKQQQQQQVPPPPPPQPQQQQQSQVHHHPPTTHILPPSAVYSIETSGYPQQQQQQQQQHATQAIQQPMAAPREPTRHSQQRSLNPASIINQPLPEIPQAAKQPSLQQQQSKISPQPLCAANLNQYRSLQRPQAQKMQLSPSALTQQQQLQAEQYAQQHAHSHQAPKAAQQNQQPPSLPPKNRHKSARDTINANNMQTMPSKSSSLRQQQSTSFGYERDRERDREVERERSREREREQREREREREQREREREQREREREQREREREREQRERDRMERNERPRRSETLDNTRSGGVPYMDHQFGGQMKKQHSYDSSSHHQQYFQQQQQPQSQRLSANATNNNQYHVSTSTSKHQQQQQQQQQYIAEVQQQYYRSLKRGGSHGNSDLYSVTEL